MASGGARRGTGPKPKPHELKVLEGAYQSPAQRANQPPPVQGGFPEAPDNLTEMEAKLWATFPRPAWIGETDVLAVRAAVAVFAMILEAGPAADAKDREALSKLWGRLMGILATLGLTPADRSKMQVPPRDDDAEDRWAGLLN